MTETKKEEPTKQIIKDDEIAPGVKADPGSAAFTSPVAIKRFGETRTLEKGIVSKISKPYAGHEFFIFKTDAGALTKDLSWIDTNWAAKVINRAIQKAMLDIYQDAFDSKTGKFDKQKYITDLEDFTSGRTTLRDLMSDSQEFMEQIVELNEKRTAMELAGEVDTEKYFAVKAEFDAVINRVKPLRAEISKLQVKLEEKAKKIAAAS
jgi:hypothetical protein